MEKCSFCDNTEENRCIILKSDEASICSECIKAANEKIIDTLVEKIEEEKE